MNSWFLRHEHQCVTLGKVLSLQKLGPTSENKLPKAEQKYWKQVLSARESSV